MAVNTCDDFLGVLQKSALLDAARLEAARNLVRGLSEPAAVARKLVQQNFLSRWQAQQLLAGRHTLLISKYRLLDLLGNDAVGPSYLAEHTQMDRRVVLKALARREGNSSTAIGKFLSEAAALATLDHRHLSHIYDVDHEGDFYYLVMEHVQGRNLQQVVDSDGPLPIEAAAGLIALAADAIAHAHEQGILHLRLRPDRLVVDGQGMLKVLDIGVARLADRDSPDGSVSKERESLAYRAPELLSATEPPDARADIYGLGAILYLLLTGELPTASDGSDALDPRRKRAEVPTELAHICQKMTAPRPPDRYASSLEAAAALKDWLQQVETQRANALAKAAAARPRSDVNGHDNGSAPAPIVTLPDEPFSLKRPLATTASGAQPVLFHKAADQRKLLIGVGSGVALAAIVAVVALFWRTSGPVAPISKKSSGAVVQSTSPAIDIDKRNGAHPKPSLGPEPSGPESRQVASTPLGSSDAQGELAYWRFEKPAAASGKPSPEAPAVPDASGSGNHLFLPKDAAAVKYSTSVSAPKVRKTGAENRQSLDDTPPAASTGQPAAWGLVTRAAHQPRDLAAAKLATWTVEASFLLEQLGVVGTIVGKEGPMYAGPGTPLQLRVRNDDDLIEIAAVDATGAPRSVKSLAPVVAGRWYHVAAASDGKKLRLWVDVGDGSGPKLQGDSAFIGPLAQGVGEWSVGRGHKDSKAAGDSVMSIDEVRITAASLAPTEMLMHATPEQLAAEKALLPAPTKIESESPSKLQFHPLKIIRILGPKDSDMKFQPQDDGSTLVQGGNPDKAVYTIWAYTDLTGIRGLRLEALADSRLPGGGPGRFPEKQMAGNFVVSAVRVAVSAREADPRPAPITWNKATADTNQKKFDVTSLIHGKNAKEGWAIAPAMGKGHYAMLFANRPFGYPKGTWLAIKIEQNFGKGFTLGRFRLTVFTGTQPGEDPAAGLAESDRLAADRLSDPLAKVPRRRALPDLPGEGESATAETTAAVTLAKVYSSPAAPVELELLGGDTAFEMQGNRFQFEPEIKDGRRRWRIVMHVAAAATEPDTVAEVAVVGDDLKFRWTDQGARSTLANYVRNCALEVSVGEAHRRIALREPAPIPKLELGFGRSGRSFRAEIPWLPATEGLKLAIPANQANLPKYTVAPEEAPAARGKFKITFGDAGQPLLIAVVESSLRKSLSLKVDLYYQPTADAERIAFVRSKLDRLKAKLNTDIARGQFMVSRAPAQAKPQLQKQVQEMEAGLKSLIGMLDMADKIEKHGGLVVQVYRQMGDHRVILAESQE